MTESLNNENEHLLIERLALAFVIRMQGNWPKNSERIFEQSLRRHKIDPQNVDLEKVLSHAKDYFSKESAELFICNGQPCAKKKLFEDSDDTLANLSDDIGCRITSTECQGPCKQAPIATLKVGGRCTMFSQFVTDKQFQSIVEYAGRAAQAGTLSVDTGIAQQFYFDPAHHHEKPNPLLTKLSFLIGRHSGSGKMIENEYLYHKEVITTWEAGGQHIALRMAADYPLPAGGFDRHSVLCILSANSSQDYINARIFTDNGDSHDFQLHHEGEQFIFEDIPPHEAQAVRARKILSPTPYGYLEKLEVDRGDNQYIEYAVVELHRTDAEL